MIVLEGNVSYYNSARFPATGVYPGTGSDLVSQHADVIAWYHYYSYRGKTLFTEVGFGVYSLTVGARSDYGPGVLLGAGTEFARHWQLGIYFARGQTSRGGKDFSHSHLNFLLSVIAF